MTITQFMSEPENFAYVCEATDAADKRKRIAELKKRYDAQFSSVVNFGDNGSWVTAMGGRGEEIVNEEFSFMNDAEFDFASFNEKAKQEAAMSEIRRLTLSHTIRDNLRQWILKKNAIAKRNRERKAEAREKQHETHQNNNVSRPFWW